MAKKVSKNIHDTARIARGFLRQVKKGNAAIVVGLSGQLGAGKTAFVKAVAKHLKVKDTVNSPTFVILKKYPIPKQVRYRAGPLKNKKHRYLVHIDAYRLKKGRELEALGWRDTLQNPDNLVFIEWPENVKKAMPRKIKHIRINHGPDGRRRFEL